MVIVPASTVIASGVVSSSGMVMKGERRLSPRRNRIRSGHLDVGDDDVPQHDGQSTRAIASGSRMRRPVRPVDGGQSGDERGRAAARRRRSPAMTSLTSSSQTRARMAVRQRMGQEAPRMVMAPTGGRGGAGAQHRADVGCGLEQLAGGRRHGVHDRPASRLSAARATIMAATTAVGNMRHGARFRRSARRAAGSAFQNSDDAGAREADHQRAGWSTRIDRPHRGDVRAGSAPHRGSAACR